MPIYKYECKTCAHVFEDLRGFNDPNPEACPECGEGQIRRLISGGNFHLKGSGWYVTDYGGSKSGAAAKDSSETSSESSESSSSSETAGADSAGGSSDGTEAA